MGLVVHPRRMCCARSGRNRLRVRVQGCGGARVASAGATVEWAISHRAGIRRRRLGRGFGDRRTTSPAESSPSVHATLTALTEVVGKRLTAALACETLDLPYEIREALDDVSAPVIDYPEDVR